VELFDYDEPDSVPHIRAGVLRSCGLPSRNNASKHRVQYDVTTQIRYRWILPIGHTAVDVLLLAAWISYGVMLLRHEKTFSSVQPIVTQVLLQNDTVEWEPRATPPPPRFELLLTGAFPAGMVSATVRPKCWWITRKMARSGLGLLILGPWSAANVGVLLQFLFWFGLAVYGVVRGVQWIGRAVARIRTSVRVLVRSRVMLSGCLDSKGRC
jgi:hypothetical protein